MSLDLTDPRFQMQRPAAPAPAGFDPMELFRLMFGQQTQQAQMQNQLKRDLLLPKHETNLMSGADWAATFGGPQEGSRNLTYGPGMSDGRTLPPMPNPARGLAPADSFAIDPAAFGPSFASNLPIDQIDPEAMLRRNRAMARPGGLSRYRVPSGAF